MIGFAFARALVPGDSFIVIGLVDHFRQFLLPAGFGVGNQLASCLATVVAGIISELGQHLFRYLACVTLDGDVDILGQPDSVRVDIHLNNFGVFRPVVDAVTRQRREGVQAGAKRQHHVSPGDKFHRRLRAVVA